MDRHSQQKRGSIHLSDGEIQRAYLGFKPIQITALQSPVWDFRKEYNRFSSGVVIEGFGERSTNENTFRVSSALRNGGRIILYNA